MSCGRSLRRRTLLVEVMRFELNAWLARYLRDRPTAHGRRDEAPPAPMLQQALTAARVAAAHQQDVYSLFVTVLQIRSLIVLLDETLSPRLVSAPISRM